MGDKLDVNEFSTLLLNVSVKRKLFPELCSKHLSNTLKIQINNLKSATVELNNSECTSSNDNWCISKNIKEEIAKSVHNIHLLDISNKAEDILEETRGIKRVLDQFQKEKTCEMDIYLRMFSKDYKNT
ncbi:uncharacterized protein LOC111875465 isoform X2 [Cryptotermes secundus]|uniref:uncharacterized protein LOC111875465 isoform X2 n=1 Tax=Cryptotermes secundus TaxID=105785 RepID=UPI000CD7D5E6|nr:uncharacterized protein LOC111875465 isoform X2 [Cryptotermes secundus]